MPHTYSILNVPFSEKNCVVSEPPASLAKGWRLRDGLPVASDWPKRAKLAMDGSLGGVAVKDAIYNQVGVLMVTDRLKKVLEESLSGKTEYLPFSLLNTKGKPVDGTFWVANLNEVADCVDRERTEGTEARTRPGTYAEITKLVLDMDKIPKGPNLFRIAPSPEIFVARDDIRAALEKGGFSGIRFLELG